MQPYPLPSLERFKTSFGTAEPLELFTHPHDCANTFENPTTIKRADRLNQSRVLYLNGIFDVAKEMKKKAIQLLVIGLIVAVAVNYLNGLLFGI